MADTRFFTNEDGKTVRDRFNELLKHTQTFDCIVGYFYASGFSYLSESLIKTDKIRILIGLSTDRETYDLIQESKTDNETSIKMYPHKKVKEKFSDNLRVEMEKSEDSYDVEKGVNLFIEWLKSKKLEIKVYNRKKIHAKVYIMKLNDNNIDNGRVITGSSNFSKSGLENNFEFNVELKENSDYEYAQNKFNELWEDAVDVSEEFISTIKKDTWLTDQITPYELYLKFLYEYLKEQINIDLEEREIFLPDGYMELQYQKDAVTDAQLKLEQYNGVFISDVVGLGKTYITAMLLKTLNSRALILAPPVLVDRKNPGSWPRVLEDFGVGGCYCESVGKLDQIIKRTNISRYDYVVIDEAHKFRNERTQMYDELYRICIGKKVILVTATPLNNDPDDLLAQIKLFQPAHASTLPNPETKDLQSYFSKLSKRLVKLDRKNDKEEYLRVVRENAEKIRNDILQYLMVRRTRSSIIKYYAEDLKKQNLHFPEVADPKAMYYNFDKGTDKIFHESINIIKNFSYARYTPLLYLKKKDKQMEVGQKNMINFMKILLLKRLESSFYAFKKTVSRMVESYNSFIEMYNSGTIYTSDSSVKNLINLYDEDDFDKIERLIDEGRVQKHSSDEFEDNFITDLHRDLNVLKRLSDDWDTVKNDPKLEKFIKEMRSDQNLKDKKVLVFTESKETADYLSEKLSETFGDVVLTINGSSDKNVRQKVIDNFDGKVSEENRSDDYNILVSTEVLSEGVNLHRSNVVINYDIPWNPIRMIQRVGRINRVDTKFDWIYIYNFFPTGPIDKEIKLSDLAVAKIEAFIEMLGNDAKLLTDEEIKSHDLFNKLKRKETITGDDEEEETELKYLTEIRNIRDNDLKLFERIKRLPKKARIARKSDNEDGLITFFRRGKLKKIFICNNSEIKELDFVSAAKLLEAKPEEKPIRLPDNMFDLLGKNKKKFENVFINESAETGPKRGNDAKLLKYIKSLSSNTDGFTDDEIQYVDLLINAINDGTISKYTINKTYKEIREIKLSNTENKSLYRTIFNILRNNIDYSMILSAKYLSVESNSVKEVILSEYMDGN